MPDEPITITSSPEKNTTSSTIVGAILVVFFTILFSWYLFSRPQDVTNDTVEPTPTPIVEITTDESTETEGSLTGFEFEQNTVYRITDKDRTEIITAEKLNEVAPDESAAIARIAWNTNLEKLFIYIKANSEMHYLLFSDLYGETIRGVDHVVEAAISPNGTLIAYTKLDELNLHDLFLYNIETKEYEQILALDDPACEMDYTSIEWQDAETLKTMYKGFECGDNSIGSEESEYTIAISDYL